MPLQSDLQLNVRAFDPANVDQKTTAVNQKIIEITTNGPSWVDVGAPTYRQMRLDGKTAFPKPTVLPQGKSIEIPSRDSGRSIPCRLFYPRSVASDSKPKTKGAILHIHGGGWVLMSHESSDPLLQSYADESGCAVISAGYRLAPEHPFPAGTQDCEDVGEWLVDNSEAEFGGKLRFIGGESAGGHLSLTTTYHLLRTRPNHRFTGLLLHFGAYDLSFLPQARSFPHAMILNLPAMENFGSAFLPHIFAAESYTSSKAYGSSTKPFADMVGLKDPLVSPFYEDLEKWRGKLPKALFTCGTADCLLEDSVMMAAKWAMAGGEQILKVVEGGCHGYIAFPEEMYPISGKGKEATKEFIKEAMAAEK